MTPETNHAPSYSRARRWGIWLNVLVSCLAVLALVVMVNYLAGRHFQRFQWTRDTRYQLSPLTLQMLATLTNRVKAIVYFDPDPQNPTYSSVKGLITEYQLACPMLDVEFVDYVRMAGLGMRIKEQYKLASAADKDLVIFEANGKVKVVYERELSEYDWSTAMTTREIRRTGFKGEQLFTSAILSVSDPKQFTAYFVQGHGEHDPASESDVEGYQKFARLLQEKNIAAERLYLQTNDVPADCQLLVIAGPKSAYTQIELERVDGYLKRGGRALILFMNSLAGARKSGLEHALSAWGVDVGDNLVIDKSQGRADQTQVLVVNNYGAHAITKPLGDSQLGLVLPRSIRQIPATAPPADAPKVTELAFTSPNGMALRNVRGSSGTVETNGVVPVMAAVEKGAIAGVNADRGSIRIVVAGDSFFLGNVNLESVANLDFANLAVNWLLDRNQLLAIGPRPIHEYKILLTQAQLVSIRWILLAALPGTALALGLFVWVRRRR